VPLTRELLERTMAQMLEPQRRDYAMLEHFNLAKYRNSELAWTMNRNNSLPNWRIRLR
jgi:hypothetical protein